MPSAGRPFTPESITGLVAKGVGVAPLVLHTGVASLEADELPYPERMTVPESTAEWVNTAHRRGHRVIAVGTTVVRALETAAGDDGTVCPYDGWTDLVISPDRGVPYRRRNDHRAGTNRQSSHLMMLEAIAGRALLEASYEAALARGLPVARVRRHPPDPALTGGCTGHTGGCRRWPDSAMAMTSPMKSANAPGWVRGAKWPTPGVTCSRASGRRSTSQRAPSACSATVAVP